MKLLVAFVLFGSLAYAQGELFTVNTASPSQNNEYVAVQSHTGYFDDLYVWDVLDCKVVRLHPLDESGYNWQLPLDYVGESIVIFGDRNGQKRRTDVFAVQPPTLSKEHAGQSNAPFKANVYPNPVSASYVTVTALREGTRVEVVDVGSGKLFVRTADTQVLNIATIPAGMYILKYVQDGTIHSTMMRIK